jgi:ferric-dicitrate binding protein FerR (iron transport regulator)
VKNVLSEFARETDASPAAVERLRGGRPAPGLGALHAVDPALVTRVRARARSVRRGRSRSVRLLGIAAVLAVLAAVIVVRAPPRRLEQPLASSVRTDLPLTRDVQLAYAGSGHVEGTEQAPRIHWDAGTLDVDVTPHRGINLVVETLEGTVHVIGTAFTVTRDALGTSVTVARGTVDVACDAQTVARVEAGGVRTCLPTRPAGWLGRARALRDAGAPADAVIDAVDRGLALASPDDDSVGELVALRLDTLVIAQRYGEALRAADAYLRSGATARRADVEALVVKLRARR